MDQGAKQKNDKYFKEIQINDLTTKAFVDLGSSCNTITTNEVKRLGLKYESDGTRILKGFGNGQVASLGLTKFHLRIDDVEVDTEAFVVPGGMQEVPVLLGHTLTELPEIIIVKESDSLRFLRKSNETTELNCIEVEGSTTRKIDLLLLNNEVIPPGQLAHVKIYTRSEYSGSLYVDASMLGLAGVLLQVHPEDKKNSIP